MLFVSLLDKFHMEDLELFSLLLRAERAVCKLNKSVASKLEMQTLICFLAMSAFHCKEKKNY